MKTLFTALAFLLFSFVAALAASVSLSWNPSTDKPGGSGVAGYNVYRNGVLIGTSATNSYLDTTAAPNTQYGYTVTAFDNAGNESGQLIAAVITTSSVTVFTPLHKYYVSPTGSDSNNGLTPATAWATAGHSVVCGDVIIAAAGSYGSRFGDLTGNAFGTVSNCPSTTGGIDGTGGIYFAILLCGGPDLMSCQANGGGGPAFEVDKSNWAIEGFWATMNTNGDRGCFSALGTSSGTMWHHVAWINNIASACGLTGFGTGNVGIGNAGLDQTAVIGGIVFNGANSLGPYGVCGSGISIIPAPQNADSGIHVFISQTFIYKSTNAPGGSQCTAGSGTGQPHSDGNAIIFDAWAANGNAYAQQGVVKNNVMWLNGNSCFQVFPQGNGSTDDKPQIYVNSNTCWGNNQDGSAACQGELWFNGIYPLVAGGGLYSVSNNIFFATMASCGNAGHFNVVAAVIWATNSHIVTLTNPPVTISGNYIWSSVAPTHPDVNGDPGKNTYVVNNSGGFEFLGYKIKPGGNPVFNAPWIFGANTLEDPGLTNPAGLPTTAPDCTGYQSTVDCMLTKYNVYNNIKPTVAPLTIGYQPPSACAPDPLFPTWLKGVIYLQVRGSDIIQVSGMITAPCGM